EECNTYLDPLLDRPLVSLLYPRDGDETLLNETKFTQPALFALEYALAQLWMSWGVQPAVLLGHSLGEYVAACLAGVFSLRDGIRMVAARARLMHAIPSRGVMYAVRAPEFVLATALEAHREEIALAAVNGPSDVVISGRDDAVLGVVRSLESNGILATRLAVSHAFHSPLMSPMLEEFRRICDQVIYSAPQIGLVSNVTGQLADAEVASPDYWCKHVLATVRFKDGVSTIAAQGVTAFLEIGPKPILLEMARLCKETAGALWLPSLRADRDDWEQML